ncbi:cytochrome b6-f complex subunit PetL [Plectonema radiosum NIES-515]|jgi:cytochrome b6-f complex subunit 6|uniref:Cytochrome b6-f complex subunit 6 n=1 Tax=Plectonema radiosum NIES-515 TaxID=2986073 RepID=A0ABT3B6R8_9CYAN|nr:cytochrome b6-f complex subunit PetL [Plectonema radiosum]MCV3216630.1 cytochrome b6-f complex subunit PetL [Plectonema radiosum NIES-515]
MFALISYIGFLAVFFGIAVGLLFGLRSAKII